MCDPAVKFRAIIHYTEFMHSLRKVAARYGISKTTLSRWVRASNRPVKPICRKRPSLCEKITSTVCDTLNEKSHGNRRRSDRYHNENKLASRIEVYHLPVFEEGRVFVQGSATVDETPVS
jgi:hypothetical protein